MQMKLTVTMIKNFFTELCEQHLPVKPLPLRGCSRRLGKKNTNDPRPRRLLIKLKSEDEVRSVLAAAKTLRHSDDDHVRTSVYINADLTPTQAKLEYEKRKRRREARNNTESATSAAHAVPVTQTTCSTEIATASTSQALSHATETASPRMALNADSEVFVTVCTVVQNCCKGDEPCQWNTPIFRPSEIRNRLTDRHET